LPPAQTQAIHIESKSIAERRGKTHIQISNLHQKLHGTV